MANFEAFNSYSPLEKSLLLSSCRGREWMAYGHSGFDLLRQRMGKFFLLLLLSGCAGQAAFQDAHKLSASGDVEGGLAKYQEAVRLDPGNVEYKTVYSRMRARSIQAWLEQADHQRESGQMSAAEQMYQRVLRLEPANERANAGLAALAREVRHAHLLEAAAGDIQNKKRDAAKEKLTEVIRENPKNERAKTLWAECEDKPAPPALESLLAAAYKQTVSIDFKDASLKQVFDVVARTSGLNLLFDKDVKLDQKVSIVLKNSTVEAAIYYLLLTNHLEQQVMDVNTLLIYPNSVDKQKEYQQRVVKTFLLSNAKAASVAETLRTLLKLHDVVVDDKLNMLIVRDEPEALRLTEKLIATQDVAEPEVMLEVEILEVSRNRFLELGVDLPNGLTLTPLATPVGGALTLANLRGINRNTLGATIDPVKINANKVDTDADILANPRIRVLNREKAKIMIGNRVPSITNSVTPTGVVSESVNYLDVGLKLDVEPTIYLDNDVAIRVGLEVSNIVSTQTSAQGTVTYTIGNRSANTMLRLKDGENQILAGLINDEDRRTANKFPGLGDIPLLGRLFGSTLNDGKKSEVVLSITPHLIRNIKRPDAAASEFLSGTENSLRRRPDFSARGVEITAPAVMDAQPAAAK